MRRTFVTGGSGFIGRTLLQALVADGHQVVALDRSGSLTPGSGIQVVRGDLLHPESWIDALKGCDLAIHLAAATGAASAETHATTTAEGTRTLLRACADAGTGRFLFVSSIAAGFPETRGYAYAEAKQRAEAQVAAAGLRFAIVRPTMVFGRGSPVLRSLTALASAPAILQPGAGTARVQPVAVDDVVRAIRTVCTQGWFSGETFEVGGPEVVTIGELLQRLRMARTGRRGRSLRIPLPLIEVPLRLAERLGMGGLLPVTAGQFSSFRFDGTATPNRLQEGIAPGLTPLSGMLEAPNAQDGAASGETARAAERAAVDRECVTFTRHLIGLTPDASVRGAYAAAIGAVPALAPTPGFDQAMLGIARRGVLAARCSDAYAALFARRSALRKRLVMLLAILETRAPSSARIDQAVGGGPATAAARMAVRGVSAVVALALGIAILVPVRLLRRDRPRIA